MSDRVKTLKGERVNAWRSMEAILAASADRTMTAEERQEWDRAEARIQELDGDIRRIEQAEQIERGFSEEARDEHLERARAGGEPVGTVDEEKRYEALYGRYMRTGFKGMNAEERALMESRAQSEGTNSAGGYLVPTGYRAVITETLKAYGGFMNLTNQIHTGTGQILPWPSNDDTGNLGALLSENAQVSEVDLTVGQKQLNAWTYTSNLVLVSLQLLQDSAFDLDAFLPKKLGQRLGRAIAADLVTGSGTSRPTGILNTSTPPTTGVTAAVGSTTLSGWVGQGTQTAYQDLVNLVHSVDPAYRQGGNCRFLMNDATIGGIRQIVDSNKRPLWLPGFAGFANQPEADNIMGYPVVVDQAVATFSANALVAAFGDFEAGYITRWVQDPTFMRLSERYADFLQVGYFGFLRVDGKPDDTAAVRALKASAT